MKNTHSGLWPLWVFLTKSLKKRIWRRIFFQENILSYRSIDFDFIYCTNYRCLSERGTPSWRTLWGRPESPPEKGLFHWTEFIDWYLSGNWRSLGNNPFQTFSGLSVKFSPMDFCSIGLNLIKRFLGEFEGDSSPKESPSTIRQLSAGKFWFI